MKGYSTPSGFTLITPPSWYDADNLPCFYRQSNGQIHVLPLNSMPKGYTNDNVLDLLLYYQLIIGYNRIDTINAKTAAWSYGKYNAKIWANAALKSNSDGDGSGDWSAISAYGGVDGDIYLELQNRYIKLNESQMPWLSSLQSKGGGIDLMTLPPANAQLVERPEWYPAYLPSLFILGKMGDYQLMSEGQMNSYPKIRSGKSSGYTSYIPSAVDMAFFMIHVQSVVLLKSKSPYVVNFYLNDTVNGATAFYFKITLAFATGHTDAQEQTYGIGGDMLVPPELDADPFASGFTKLLQKTVGAVVSFFTGKIPGGSALTQVATKVAQSGGQGITGGENSPEGTFSAEVFNAADAIGKALADKKEQEANNTVTNSYIKYIGIALLIIVIIVFIVYYLKHHKK